MFEAATFGNNSSQSIFGAAPRANISSKSLFCAAPSANDSGQSLFGTAPSANNSSQSLFDAAPSANGNNSSQSLFGKTGTIGGSIGCGGLFEGCKKATPGTKIKFVPPSGQDSIVEHGLTTSINTKHQCITAMKQYENKSIEELRFEDWVEGLSFKIDRGTMHYCGEPKHFMLKKEFYCNDCSTAICKKCLTGCHKKHDCDELETMGKASRVKLQSLKKPYKEEILTQRKFLDALVDQRMKMKHEAEIACQKVDERANKFRQAVTKIVKKLKRITAASLDKNEELLSKSMTSINFKISQLDRDSVSKVSDKKSDLECIEYLHKCKKTLEDNKATSEELVVPILQTTEFHAGDIDRNLLVKMFGKIGEDATLTHDDGDDDDTDDDDDDTGLSSTGGLFGSFNNKAVVPFGTIPEFSIRTAPTSTEPKLLLGTNPTLGISKAPTTNERNVPFGTNSYGTFGFSTSDNKSKTSSQLGITPNFGMFSLGKTSTSGFGAAPSTNNKNSNSSLFGNMETSGGNTAHGFFGPSVVSASSKAKTSSFTGFSFETTKQTGADATDTRKKEFPVFVRRAKSTATPKLKPTDGISTLPKDLRFYKIYCQEPKHFMLKKEYYCNDCSMAVCKRCITDSHKKHDFDDLETVGEAGRRELESLKRPYEEEIFKQRKFLASLEDQRMTMEHGSKKACQKVDDRTNTICEAVKAIGDKIKQQSVASLDKNEEILSKSIKSINLKVSQLNPDSISKVLDEKSDLECIEYLPKCKKTLEDNKATSEELVVPTLPTTEFHADDIDRDLLVKMFGKIVEDATLTHDDY